MMANMSHQLSLVFMQDKSDPTHFINSANIVSFISERLSGIIAK